jgi:hypothetical protein
MIFCNDELTPEEVNLFKDYWNERQEHSYVNWRIGDEVLDRRLGIRKNTPQWDIIERIVGKHFATTKHIWSAYQRQNLAHHIHIDDYEKDNEGFRYTFVFSLDTEPRFKTYVWKNTCHDNEELFKFVSNWGEIKHTLVKKSNISSVEDLEHTYDENQQEYMCDYLDLDGIFTYKAGSGVLFNATQMHCTSNWLKYNDIAYRDLLQIHVLSDFELKD